MEITTYRIKEICDVKSGKRIPKGYDLASSETPYKYIRARDIKKGKISTDDVAYIDEEVRKIINKYIIQKDDIAVTIVANIGDVGICSDDCDNANLTENAVRLTSFDKNIVYPQFLNYYLSQPFMKGYMESLAIGAAQAKLGIYKIEKMKLSLPDIDIQKRVVKIISKYDELIEVNNQRIKLLEKTAEELYKEWFVRFRFPNYQNTEFENGIPKGWLVSNLGKHADIFTGKSNRQDAVDEGKFVFFDRSQETKHSNIWLYDCEGIIVPGEGTSFIPRYYKGKFDLHQRCYCVSPAANDMSMYIYYYMMLNRHYFLSVATGATVPSLRLKNFTSMKIVIPSQDILNEFQRIALNSIHMVNKLREQNENLIKQRDLLLPRLMSGKLEV